MANSSPRAIDCFTVCIVKPSAFTTYTPSTSEYLKGIVYYDEAMGPALLRETAAGVFTRMPSELTRIDIRSMRKVSRVEEEYQLVLQNVAAEDVEVDGFFNVLIKLP